MTRTERILAAISNLYGWKRAGLMFVCGGLVSLSLPPGDLWISLIIGFPALVLVLDSISATPATSWQKSVAAFTCGWWFGFGFFGISLYWIGVAFLVEPEKFALLLPLGVAVLPAGLSLFWGAACAIAINLWRQGIFRLILMVLCLSVAEWLRGNILSGFPWNLIGFASFGLGNLSQTASYVGVYGLSTLIMLWSLSPILLLPGQRNLTAFGVVAASLIAALMWGDNRLSLNFDEKTSTNIRIVQPNIPQDQKWSKSFRNTNINKYFNLSRGKTPAQHAALKNIHILIWPESALPLFYDENADLQKRVAALLTKNSVLILGNIRRAEKSSGPTGKRKFYNSVLVANSSGQVLSRYDKSHLVPFGEYLPGEKFLSPLGLRKFVNIPNGFANGSGAQSIALSNLPAFSAQICYEIIFSGRVIDQGKRPDWIVNVTNDGWFGKTAGPHQHLAQARMRAIEEGLSVVRAANTGISGVINPFGQIIKSLGLSQTGIIDARLPAPLAPPFFARFGNWIFFWLLTVLFVLLIVASILARPHDKTKNHEIS